MESKGQNCNLVNKANCQNWLCPFVDGCYVIHTLHQQMACGGSTADGAPAGSVWSEQALGSLLEQTYQASEGCALGLATIKNVVMSTVEAKRQDGTILP